MLDDDDDAAHACAHARWCRNARRPTQRACHAHIIIIITPAAACGVVPPECNGHGHGAAQCAASAAVAFYAARAFYLTLSSLSAHVQYMFWLLWFAFLGTMRFCVRALSPRISVIKIYNIYLPSGERDCVDWLWSTEGV